MASGRPGKREMLLSAARELFQRYGYRKTTIDDIVRRAGVAKGTFYLYFRGKEELFLKVLMAMRDEILADFLEKLSAIKTSAGKIAFSLRYSFEAFEEHPLLAKVTAMDEELRVVLHSIADAEVEAKLDESLKFFRGLFEEGIERGELRRDLDLDVIPIALGSLKLMHFFKDTVVATGITKEQFIDGLVELAMDGITPRRSQADSGGAAGKTETR